MSDKPVFDPAKPFEAVTQDKPAFDPNKSFEPVDSQVPETSLSAENLPTTGNQPATPLIPKTSLYGVKEENGNVRSTLPSIDSQLPHIRAAAQKAFSEHPEIFADNSARLKYVDSLVKPYSPKDQYKIVQAVNAVDPYYQEQLGNTLIESVNPSPMITSAVGAAASGILHGAKTVDESATMIAQKNPLGFLHAAVGVGQGTLGVLSAVQPELAAFNVVSESVSDKSPTASKLMAPIASNLEKKYKDAGLTPPTWENDLAEVGDFFINALAFGLVHGGKKIVDTRSAIEDFQKGLDDLTPAQIDAIYNTTQQTKQQYSAEKENNATSLNYADWLADLSKRAQEQGVKQQVDLTQALSRKTVPAHFNELDHVSLSKPVSELPDGISVNYQGKDGHISRDPQTNELLFNPDKGKSEVLGGGSFDPSAGELGIKINEGKFADQNGKYFVEKTADGHTVYKVNNDGKIKPVYESETSNVERRDAIIKKALERSNDEASVFELSKKAERLLADAKNSTSPTVAAILTDKQTEVENQIDAIHQKIAEENSTKAIDATSLHLFENHKADIKNSMESLSAEGKAAVEPEITKIEESIKKLKHDQVQVEVPETSIPSEDLPVIEENETAEPLIKNDIAQSAAEEKVPLNTNVTFRKEGGRGMSKKPFTADGKIVAHETDENGNLLYDVRHELNGKTTSTLVKPNEIIKSQEVIDEPEAKEIPAENNSKADKKTAIMLNEQEYLDRKLKSEGVEDFSAERKATIEMERKAFIQKAVKEGKYENLIAKNKMDAQTAKKLIEDAGVEVPKHLLDLTKPEKPENNNTPAEPIEEQPQSKYSDEQRDAALKMSRPEFVEKEMGSAEDYMAIRDEAVEESKKTFQSAADFIRKGKIADDITMATVPFAKEVWNGALEVLAQTIEAGGKIKDAIEKALEHIRGTDWYKGLSESDKTDAEKRFSDHINETTKSDPALFKLPKTKKTTAKINSKISNVSPATAASVLRRSTILTEKSLQYKARFTLHKFYEGYIKHIEDISGNAKEALKNAGGEETVILKDISNKSSGKASLKIKENDNKIFKDLSKDQIRSLGEIIEAKRAIQLDEIYDKRGAERLKHQSGFTSEFYQNALDGMKKENHSEFSDLEKRADDYFSAQKELLDLKKENGLLNQEGYDKLLEQSLYSPRVFIQHLDDLAAGINKGKRISVNDADIKKLDEGSEGLMVKDSRLLLGMSTSKAYSIIAKNDAAKSLYEFAKGNPKNGVAELREIIKRTKDGKPIYADIPADKDVVSAMVDGEKKDVVVSKEFANEWVSSDPAISAALGEAVQLLTGSTLLRYAATGVNPLFALANTPRDMAYVYFTADTYSSHIPVFVKQIHHDMATVASDVFARKGRYKEFVEEGGAIELLTHQGRFFTGKGENEGINKASHVLGWVGETSELLTRIAMRERGIKNGIAEFTKENKNDPNSEELKKIKIKATYDAINQLDFSQGGDWIKALNKFVPYTNAAFQATRGLARAARRNPKQFVYKAAQLAAIAGGLAAYNLSMPGYDQVSDDEKARNYIIMLSGMETTDENGNKKYKYVKIPKSQESYFLSSLAEQSVEFSMTGKKPNRQSWLAAKMQAPPIPFLTQNPPLLEAINAYQSNYDTYFDKKLWFGSDAIPNELQFYRNTPEAYRKIGEATGLSPEKLRGSVQKIVPGIEKNPFITIPIKTFGIAAEEMGLKERTNLNKSFSQNMDDVLGGLYKKYVGETFPQAKNNLFKLKEITSDKYMMQLNKSVQELRKRGDNDRADEAIREHKAQVEELVKLTNQDAPKNPPKTEEINNGRKEGTRH